MTVPPAAITAGDRRRDRPPAWPGTPPVLVLPGFNAPPCPWWSRTRWSPVLACRGRGRPHVSRGRGRPLTPARPYGRDGPHPPPPAVSRPPPSLVVHPPRSVGPTGRTARLPSIRRSARSGTRAGAMASSDPTRSRSPSGGRPRARRRSRPGRGPVGCGAPALGCPRCKGRLTNRGCQATFTCGLRSCIGAPPRGQVDTPADERFASQGARRVREASRRRTWPRARRCPVRR